MPAETIAAVIVALYLMAIVISFALCRAAGRRTP